jgi:glycosyltransferase involved in cell wall biosynthesis
VIAPAEAPPNSTPAEAPIKSPRWRRPARLCIVCSHPIQYLSPWFRRLAACPALDVTVLYGDDHGLRAGFDPDFGRDVRWDVDLLSGYKSRLLQNHAPRPGVGRFFGIWSADLLRLLSPRRFDAVLIQGWNYALYPLALFCARLHGLPVLLRCESVLSPDGERAASASLSRRGKDALLRKYVGQCAAGLAVSSGNRRLLLHYGLPEERIFFSPYAVDVERFRLPESERAAARLAWRQRLGVPGDMPLLLFVGKLIDVKDPSRLLSAFLALRRLGVAARLAFCGDGELLPQLRAMAQASPHGRDVSFLGFFNQAELPALYAAADALVLPSRRETFGVVVAEALSAGLPVVVSDGVGCAEDLVVGPGSGLHFPVGDEAALLSCLARLCDKASGPALRKELAARGEKRIATFTYAESTQGLISALSSILPTL